MDYEERFSRQKQIVPLEKLKEYSAPLIVGVGAIGRNVAIQLAAMGVEKMVLVDFDTVEESNIASQGYMEEDLGKLKVEATARVCRAINSNIDISCVSSKFKRGMDSDIVFCCVDSISTREFIWRNVCDKSMLFVDGRMAAEVFRIITIDTDAAKRYYPTTIFAESEAFVGSCTAKSTIYCSNIAAGFMVQSFSKWLREFPNDADICYNLLGNDLIIMDNNM
jgi:molybdopterin/thiamine biosynthesis adenylyltransferase